MIISWIVFAGLVAIFAYRGYRQGIWAASTRIISLIMAYVTALFFATDLAPVIEAHTVIQGLAALISASLLLFFGVSMLLSLGFSLLGKLFKSDKPSSFSAALGALMGGVVGSVVGLAAVFLVSYLMEVLPKARLPLQAQNPNAIERLARSAAGKVVTWVGGVADMDPSTAKISAALVREPGVMVNHIQNLQQNQDVRDLFSEGSNRAALSSGNIESIQALPAFQNVARNSDVQQLMKVAGLNDDGNAEAVLAGQMSTIWQRAELIQNDQRLQSILKDPKFRQQLENGNPMALLNNADFMEVASVLLGGDTGRIKSSTEDSGRSPSADSIAPELDQSFDNSPSRQPTIVRWVDEDGVIHYGNRQPDSVPQ